MAHFEGSGLVAIVVIIIIVAVVVWVLHQSGLRHDDSREDERERRGRLRGSRGGDGHLDGKNILGWIVLIVIILVVVYLVSAAAKGLHLDSWWDRQKGAAAAAGIAAEYGAGKHRRQYGNW